MKRINLFLLLCAFVLAFSVGAWAEDLTKLPASQDGVIDLGGKTYVITNSSNVYSQTAGEVTIKNGTIHFGDLGNTDCMTVKTDATLTLSGDVTITAQNGAALWVESGGKLIINGAKITTSKDKAPTQENGAGYVLVVATGNTASIEMNSGLISSDHCSAFLADNGATAVINGGTIRNSANFCTAYSRSNGKITVNGGEIIAAYPGNDAALVAASGTVEVHGGLISSDQFYGLLAHSHNSTTPNGFAYVDGGTFSGKEFSISDASNDRESRWQQGTVKISGGSFANGEEDAKPYLAPGFVSIESTDKNYYFVVKDVVSSGAPTASAITYGQTLANSTLTAPSQAPKAVKDSADVTSVDVQGTWTWSDDTKAPQVADSDTTEYEVVFTPADTSKFKTISTKVKITVSKATLTVTTPTGLSTTYGKTLADLTLPTADNGTWAWVDATTNVGNVGTNKFKAKFTPTDTNNYNTPDAVDVSVTVTKANATVDSAPTAITGLTYNGSAQALIKAGTATPAIQYSVDGTNYSDSIPQGTEAKSYTVYYKAAGNDNYTESAAQTLSVTISKSSAELKTEPGTSTLTTINNGSKTSKTTTFTLGSGTSASVFSVDVAITAQEAITANVGDEISTLISVDTVLTGNKEFKQYAYSMDITGLPEWLSTTGELKSSDANADSSGKYHHEFTLKGTPSEILADGNITFTALITLSSDNYTNALKASADKTVTVNISEKPIAPVITVSDDKILIVQIDLTNGSVDIDPVIVKATAGTNFEWKVSGDLPKDLLTTSDDTTLTISGIISDDTGNYSVSVIASNSVGSDDVTVTFNLYKIEIDSSGAVVINIDQETIDAIKQAKEEAGGTSDLTLSDLVDVTTLNEALGAEGSTGELKLTNGITTLEGISQLTNLKTLDLTEVATLTTGTLSTSDLGTNTTEIKLGENNTSITSVDLTGSNVQNVSIPKSSVKELTFGENSKVTTINAKDSASLEKVDFSNLTNVQNVDISGTAVEEANLENCTNLETFSFDVVPETDGEGTTAGALKTLKLPETSTSLKSLAVRGNQLLWLGLSNGTEGNYPNLTDIRVRGQRRGDLTISMVLDLFEFLWNLYQQSLYDNEADYEPYTEGTETPFDISQISTDITYIASDDETEQKATVTDGKINFARTPKNFKYEYDTGFRRPAANGSFIAADDEADDEEDGNMDVTFDTASVTTDGSVLSSNSGGCEVGFSLWALSALIVFANLKKRR